MTSSFTFLFVGIDLAKCDEMEVSRKPVEKTQHAQLEIIEHTALAISRGNARD